MPRPVSGTSGRGAGAFQWIGDPTITRLAGSWAGAMTSSRPPQLRLSPRLACSSTAGLLVTPTPAPRFSSFQLLLSPGVQLQHGSRSLGFGWLLLGMMISIGSPASGEEDRHFDGQQPLCSSYPSFNHSSCSSPLSPFPPSPLISSA